MIADADLAILPPVSGNFGNTKLDIWITTSLSLNYECVHVRLCYRTKTFPIGLSYLITLSPPQYPSGQSCDRWNILFGSNTDGLVVGHDPTFCFRSCFDLLDSNTHTIIDIVYYGQVDS